MTFLTDWLGKIHHNCIFTKDIKLMLKSVLAKDGTNRANIRREASRQIISII